MALPDPRPDHPRRGDPPPPPHLNDPVPPPGAAPGGPPARPAPPPEGGHTPPRGTPAPDAPVRVARADAGPGPEAEAPGTAPRPAPTVDVPTGESPAARPEGTGGDEARSLRSDLDEVAGARPERAFNVGATLGIILTVAAVVFVVQNSGATAFEFLWFDFRLPLWTVLVGTLAVGALLMLAAFAMHRRRRRRIDRRKQATGRLQRALPDAPEPRRRRFGLPRRHNAPA